MIPRARVLLLLLLAVAVSCAPQIGDPCLSNIECPEGASCDTSALGGYCLIYDCTEETCPDGSVCIRFRTFSACMDHCETDADCRVEDNHVCRSDLPPASFCYHPQEGQ
jgi:hypothetical protein